MFLDIDKGMADIFISYARVDRPKAQLLADIFEGRDWSVWWDTRLKAGDVWDDVIERKLNAARCVVVLWSKTSVQKQWVRVEAGEGLKRRILVPAFIEDVQPPLAFRLIQGEHLIDWRGDSLHPGLNRLLAAVVEVVAPRKRRPAPRRANKSAGADAQLLHDLAVFRDVDALWCPEMVALPAGTFLMGSPKDEEERYKHEGPQHRATIGYRLAIGRYPVTYDEYDHFCTATKREKPGDEGGGRGRRPVINVSWLDAQAYVEWLARETGKPYRLPTEAEWEYACRAGTTTPFSFGETITTDQANYNGNFTYGQGAKGVYRLQTTEVGSFAANPWGLYDMHGNVWEWVEDVWHDSYEGAPDDGSAWTDGEGKKSSNGRVIRGGSWNYDPGGCRSAFRNWFRPDLRGSYLGFRVARTLD